MKKKPKLKYVKFQFTKGTLYSYFNTGEKVAGKTVFTALPPYNSPGFFDSYAALLGHRQRRSNASQAVHVTTVSGLIKVYERSDEYKALKPKSKKLYGHTLDKIAANFGDFPAEDVTPGRVLDVLENVIEGNATKNVFMAVISAVFKRGRLDGLTAMEPTKDLSRYKTGEHDPWPPELLEIALKTDDHRVRLAVHLLYFTGQRIGDVCNMEWTDIKTNRVKVIQEKTGKPLLVALHQDLATELENVQRTGETIIAGRGGLALSPHTVRENIQSFAKDLGFKVVPHGLRKNAVNSLLEAGAFPQEVAAVTGQSMQMIEHYAKKVNQPLMGDAAIQKLERAQK